MVVHQQGGSIHASANNSETMYRTDLKIGEMIYEFVSYNIPSFWLISLNGFDLILLLRDSQNDLLILMCQPEPYWMPKQRILLFDGWQI